MANFLVTGGAGYVGSHLVLALNDAGHSVTVYDNLHQGHRAAIPACVAFIHADLADQAALDNALAAQTWDAVFHFAALSIVGDSMRDPFHYFRQNAMLGIGLIEACVRHKIPKFILSSTAALFSAPRRLPIDEDEVIIPGSPYGESKLMLEQTLRWADQIFGFRSACLRYFNAAGADPHGRAGEAHAPETHLIPLVIDAALGRRPELTLFGDDYPTPDGTCIRDYIHVSDLASAHIAVLPLLETRSVTYNLGNGAGHSVRDVINAVQRVTGLQVPYRVAARRAGDPPVLVASAAKLRAETGWQPHFPDLDIIVAHAYQWRRAHPDGYA